MNNMNLPQPESAEVNLRPSSQENGGLQLTQQQQQ